MRQVTLPGGETVPALGQGTWYMGEKRGARKAEAEALRLGIDLGMTLIDTAEMYANGGAEEVDGEPAEALHGRPAQAEDDGRHEREEDDRRGIDGRREGGAEA